jgi:hypothetical protein
MGATTKLFQYELQSQNIDSIVVIDTYDGAMNPFGSYFHTMQMGPDGKIYESCGNGENVYHVIERPDEKGDSCLFIQHVIHLPTFSGGVPNFPNYRLGALTGSTCDTLTGLNETATSEKEQLLKVFPNPAADFITVDYGFTDWSKGEISLEITDGLGQTVYQQKLPTYSGFQKINVSNFTSSIFVVYIKRMNRIVATAKFAKQ